MDQRTVSIGVKVFAAIVSGVAVFLGISKIANCNNTPEKSGGTNSSNGQQSNSSTGDTIIRGLRGSQDGCRNAAGFIGALSNVAEKAMVLLGKAPAGYYDRGGYFGSGGGDIRLRRKSQYIIEAVGDGDIYDDNLDQHYI